MKKGPKTGMMLQGEGKIPASMLDSINCADAPERTKSIRNKCSKMVNLDQGLFMYVCEGEGAPSSCSPSQGQFNAIRCTTIKCVLVAFSL